jgi:RHS repeat-associated protein
LRIDETFTRTISGGTETLLVDALGSTVGLANGSGSVQTEYTYEPFGKTSVSGTNSTSAIQFTGRENDGTGLYAYRARYYHSAGQRFISEDPLSFGGGPNIFAYAANAPTTLVDPLGLKPSPHFGGSGSGASGGGGSGAGGGDGARSAGKGAGKDDWFGHDDPDFQDWYHRKWKKGKGRENASKDELDEAQREWEQHHKPKRDPKADWDRTERDVKEMVDWVNSHRREILITAAGVTAVGGLIYVTGGIGGGVLVLAF